jgi:hypothetical protein
MIDFTRAFSNAWERMVILLFHPFDLGKWFTIGFSAFLAGLLSGGNGFNGYYNNGDAQNNYSQTWTSKYGTGSLQYNTTMPTLPHWGTGTALVLVLLTLLIVFAFILLLYWLGARGQFLLLDNIVRNRAAIAWPWKNYRRHGNRLFGCYLLLVLLTLTLLLPFIIIGVILALPFAQHHHWPQGSAWTPFALLALAYLAVLLPVSILLFLFRELGVPLMFRHDLTPRAALGETWKLIRLWPGTLALLILLRLALFVALVVTSTIVCCVTCCAAALPYLGTVLLLPAILYIKAFTLDVLAQFGPYYDVWIVDVPAPPTFIR